MNFLTLLFASREPLFEFEFENALFAFAYDKPPFAFELLFERPTTRHEETLYLFRCPFTLGDGRSRPPRLRFIAFSFISFIFI